MKGKHLKRKRQILGKAVYEGKDGKNENVRKGRKAKPVNCLYEGWAFKKGEAAMKKKR